MIISYTGWGIRNAVLQCYEKAVLAKRIRANYARTWRRLRMQLPWDAASGTVPSWFHTIPSRLHTTSHHFGTYMAPTSATGTLIFDYFGCRRKKSRIPFPARHRSALVTSPGVTSAAYPYGADGPTLGPKARTPLWPHGRGESAPVDARRPDVGVAGCERPWEPVALQLWQRHALPNGWGTTVWAEMPGSRRTCARGAPRAGAEDRNDDFYRYCFAFFCPDLSTPNHQAPLRYRHALGSTLAVVHGRGCFTEMSPRNSARQPWKFDSGICTLDISQFGISGHQGRPI